MTLRRAGFSLIELLVVIAIILLLMGLLLPVIGYIQQQKRVLLATTEVRDLVAAVEQYQQAFLEYPPDPGAFPTGDTPDTFIDPDAIYKCLSINRVDPKTGARGGPYYTFKDASRMQGPNKMTFLDPWGKPYQLDAFHMDKTREKKIGEPYPAGGDASRKGLGVKIWSVGPDGKDSSGSNQFEGKGTAPEDQDNIGSWTQ